MYNRTLQIYINNPVSQYLELNNGKVVNKNEISLEEYEALKEWGVIVKEFEN